MDTDMYTTRAGDTAVPATSSVIQLSFTGHRPDGGVDLWAPAETSEGWGEECRVGRGYGYEAAGYIRETGDAALLPGIVRTIAERGALGGVEVGFFTALSTILSDSA